jgi:3'-phosphoadenosine 5'-phosphosulfate sulfotransferase (PAPS reductase)/FAD synthetase
MKVYDLFVSGGKDSTVAAVLGAEEAEREYAEARIVFINELKAFKIPENILETTPLDYVEKLSEWLGLDLVILEPEIDFWEGVKKWGYPTVFNKRWCFGFMKRDLLRRFAREERKSGFNPTWVTGIRRSESSRRSRMFRSKRYIFRVGNTYLEYYHPILDWDEEQVERFIESRGIPVNPLWEVGFSFECICMAGTGKSKLDKIILCMPELAKWLAEKDREIQKYRREGTGYIACLLNKKIRLHRYIEDRLKQSKITSYL